MMKNRGIADRIIRTIIALILGILIITGNISGTWDIILGAFAIILLLTSAIGWRLSLSQRRSDYSFYMAGTYAERFCLCSGEDSNSNGYYLSSCPRACPRYIQEDGSKSHLGNRLQCICHLSCSRCALQIRHPA